MPTGYESIYEYLVPQLAGVDFKEAAPRLGMALQADGSVTLPLLGRMFRIDCCSVTATDGQPAHVNARSVLAYYALSQGAGQPAGRFSPLGRFANTIAGTVSAVNWMTDPLSRAYNGRPETLGRCIEALGGECVGTHNGELAWRLQALPKIPALVVYHAADDEFPCEVEVQYDEHAGRFLEFECLAFLNGCVVGALKST